MKPIFVIKTCSISREGFETFKQSIRKKVEEIEKDYHVLIVAGTELDYWKFQVFSDHEIKPIELEKLKEIVNASEVQ